MQDGKLFGWEMSGWMVSGKKRIRVNSARVEYMRVPLNQVRVPLKPLI